MELKFEDLRVPTILTPLTSMGATDLTPEAAITIVTMLRSQLPTALATDRLTIDAFSKQVASDLANAETAKKSSTEVAAEIDVLKAQLKLYSAFVDSPNVGTAVGLVQINPNSVKIVESIQGTTKTSVKPEDQQVTGDSAQNKKVIVAHKDETENQAIIALQLQLKEMQLQMEQAKLQNEESVKQAKYEARKNVLRSYMTDGSMMINNAPHQVFPDSVEAVLAQFDSVIKDATEVDTGTKTIMMYKNELLTTIITNFLKTSYGSRIVFASKQSSGGLQTPTGKDLPQTPAQTTEAGKGRIYDVPDFCDNIILNVGTSNLSVYSFSITKATTVLIEAKSAGDTETVAAIEQLMVKHGELLGRRGTNGKYGLLFDTTTKEMLDIR